MALDLSFLNEQYKGDETKKLPVNVYEVLRDAWRETRVDMTLQFFFDPNERHGLGTLVIDAFLNCLDGAHFISSDGKTVERFDAAAYLGSLSWEIGTQVDYIDVLLINEELGLVIVLENKIHAVLNNPLDGYSQTALGRTRIPKLLTVVLAPQVRNPPQGMENWLSRAVTYQDLFAAIKRDTAFLELVLGPETIDQKRSIDLLQQFMEIRGSLQVSNLDGEAKILNDWRRISEVHQDAIQKFDEARERVQRILTQRNRRLADPIKERIAAAELGVANEFHGQTPRHNDYWNTYIFEPANRQIELKLSYAAPLPEIYVLDRGETDPARRITPLGVGWTASDEEIAEAFVDRVKQILAS